MIFKVFHFPKVGVKDRIWSRRSQDVLTFGPYRDCLVKVLKVRKILDLNCPKFRWRWCDNNSSRSLRVRVSPLTHSTTWLVAEVHYRRLRLWSLDKLLPVWLFWAKIVSLKKVSTVDVTALKMSGYNLYVISLLNGVLVRFVFKGKLSWKFSILGPSPHINGYLPNAEFYMGKTGQLRRRDLDAEPDLLEE